MNLFVWNCNGSTSWEFLRTTKEMIRRYRLCLMCYVETKISGLKADQVCRKLGLDSWIIIEVVGFNRGIWVLCKDCIKLEVIRTILHLFI